jgi:acyl carrier protein
LAEIENALRTNATIEDAVVLAKKDLTGETCLVAYLVAKEKLQIADVKACLNQHLPDYMLPAHFMQLPSFPLTSNGKTDKKALPGLDGLAVSSTAEYVKPVTEAELKLAAIWAEVLGIDQEAISLHGNFFELGGHSLRATTLALKIDKAFGIKIPLTAIFKNAALKDLAKFIENITWLKQNDLQTENLKEIEI